MVLSKKEVGQLIKEARKIKSAALGQKYTQSMLASELGISRGYLGDIEAGRTYPNFVMLNKIANACSVPISFLTNERPSFVFTLEKFMKEKGVTAGKLATDIGISENTINDILSNKENIPLDIPVEEYTKLNSFLGISENDILDWLYDDAITQYSIKEEKGKTFLKENSPHYKLSKTNPGQPSNYNLKEDIFIPIPVVGIIHAGQPMFAEQNIEGYFPTDKQFISNDREYFYLRITGDSMDKEFKEGSLVLVQKQDYLENGEIGVVLVNGYDATVKKVFIKDNLVTLMPQSNNHEYQPQIYDMSKEEVRILGKVVLAVKKY